MEFENGMPETTAQSTYVVGRSGTGEWVTFSGVIRHPSGGQGPPPALLPRVIPLTYGLQPVINHMVTVPHPPLVYPLLNV